MRQPCKGWETFARLGLEPTFVQAKEACYTLQTRGKQDFETRYIMFQAIRYRKQAQAWQERFDALAPKAGDLAPDFELYDLDGANPVRLSDFQGQKPVALIFGSFT